MKNKGTLTIIFVVIVLIVIGYLYMKGKASTDTGKEPISLFPSITEIMEKGYSQSEASQILDSLKAGKISSY